MAEPIHQEFGFLTELERYDAFLRYYRSSDPADKERLDSLYHSADPLIPLILLQYLEDIPEKAATAAIIGLIEDGVEIVSRSAMASYQRCHYPGKPRLLKQLILSRSARACRFAVRTLSRAGFMEILPLVLREVPEREADVRPEMIIALRYLPDPRSLSVLLPLAASPEEGTRFLAARVLADLQPRLGQPGAGFFVKLSRDDSERVRRVALEALQRFPSRRVAPMILETALDPNAPEDGRIRAIRSLSAFPSKRWVKPLAAIASGDASAVLRLSAEISLRAFPREILRAGLEPLLADPDPGTRRQAQLFLADFLGSDAKVRSRLLSAWKKCDEAQAFELVDALRLIPGPEVEALLAEAVLRDPMIGYGAASALAGRRGPTVGRTILTLLDNKELDPLILQTLLDRFAKRGPDADVKADMMPLLFAYLLVDNINVRYLSVRILAWYPLEAIRRPLLDLLAVERDRDIAKTAVDILAKGAGRDPRPLLEAVAAHPLREDLVVPAFRLAVGSAWDPECAEGVVSALAGPDGLLTGRPRLLAAALARLFEHGTASLPRVWAALGGLEARAIFLRMLASALRNPRRVLPPLPLAFLETQLHGAPPELRALHYGLLGADGRNLALKALVGILVKEPDAALKAAGAEHVRKLLREAPR